MLVVLHLGNGDEAKHTKDTSTKRAIILAYVDNVPETHFNLSKILNSFKVHMMKYHHTIALWGSLNVKLEFRDSSQISTTAPIFMMYFTFTF